MAEETESTAISKSDVEGVAGKLEEFAEGLPEQERNVLGWILTRAQAAGEADTEGYALERFALQGYSTPIAAQLGRAAGLGAAAGTTTVSWGYKFKEAFGPSLGRQF